MERDIINLESWDKMSHKVYAMSFASIYKMYINKALRKGKSKEDVDTIIKWLTSYSDDELQKQIDNEVSMEVFFEEAHLNSNAPLIKGLICGVRVEDVEEELMQKIRYLDKLIDELARGKTMDKILRK